MAKKHKDFNQSAKSIIDIATGESNSEIPKEEGNKNPAAVQLGRLGGLKGGAARAKSLTPEKRKEIAQRAAAKRWKKED